MDEIYYRVMLDRHDKIRIVEMQSFDECDYDQNRFLTEEHFETESEAEDFVMEKANEYLGGYPEKIRNALKEYAGIGVKNIFDRY